METRVPGMMQPQPIDSSAKASSQKDRATPGLFLVKRETTPSEAAAPEPRTAVRPHSLGLLTLTAAALAAPLLWLLHELLTSH